MDRERERERATYKMSKRNNLIDDILAKSEALVNTQSRSDGIPHIKRGVSSDVVCCMTAANWDISCI